MDYIDLIKFFKACVTVNLRSMQYIFYYIKDSLALKRLIGNSPIRITEEFFAAN